jgi:hypothetical protein
MDATDESLDRRQQELLSELAELEVERQRRRGMLKRVPHFSEIERAGRNLGQFLSRLTQSRLGNEVAAEEAATRACPTCGLASVVHDEVCAGTRRVAQDD